MDVSGLGVWVLNVSFRVWDGAPDVYMYDDNVIVLLTSLNYEE